MKVLFLINNLSGGGAEKVLVNLANALAERGHKITVRALINKGKNIELLTEKVNYEYIFKKHFRGVNYLYLLPHKWIYNKVAFGDFDVIVVYLHGVLTKIVSYAPKTQKTVAYLHANMETSPFIKGMRNKQTIQRYFENYERIASVSEDVQNSFIKVSDINDDRLTVKYNTFDIESILSLSKEPLEKKHKVNNEFSICSVGKLEAVKGYERLLSIINRLKNDEIPVKLTIVGEGAERPKLEKYISDNNLFDIVKLQGFDTNPYKYIANSDLFVCSSFSEGFSSVVAESLILGVPVVTTECVGMKELLGKNNEYGIVVNNDEDSLYKAVKDVISNSETLEKYRESAIERGKFFKPEQTVDAVEKMLEEILK